MAIFKEGSWVAITPTPDKRWEHWTDTHTSMSGEYALIMTCQDDQVDPSIRYIYLRTHTIDGTTKSEAWFLERHVILAAKADVYSSNNLKKQCEDLQVWEGKKKRLLDNQLKHIFGKKISEGAPTPKKRKRKKIKLADSGQDSAATIYDDDDDEYDNTWGEATQEIDLEQLEMEFGDFTGWDGS
tara:strand:- start:523 stop:1074 length:552 start_codon:yes stop_codon:yes gene_type:complete